MQQTPSQYSLLVIKPTAVRRALVGRIISRFEDKGYRIIGIKFMQFTKELASEFYAEHKEKPFFSELIEHIISGPVVAFVVEGHYAVSTCRKMLGETDPCKSYPGTIRGDFGLYVTYNIIHGSDSVSSAKREIGIIFPELISSLPSV